MTGKGLTPEQAIDKAAELYEAAADRLRAALEAFVTKGETPDPKSRTRGDFCYPQLRLYYDEPTGPPPPLSRAFAKLAEEGVYATTITQPVFFRSYLLEQLNHIVADYPVKLEVGVSKSRTLTCSSMPNTSTPRRCRRRSSRAGFRRRR
jgi:AMP nucleosidase